MDKRLALMGGTFDPIHMGHLAVAQSVCEELRFEKIIFIPDFIPPHKQKQEFSPAQDRLAMLQLALKGYHRFFLDEMEIKKGGLSYTFQTIEAIRHKHPEYKLYFLIGADSLGQLSTWYRIKDLLEEVRFVVARRPGYQMKMEEFQYHFGPAAMDKIIFVEAAGLNISSTDIRRRVRAGVSITGLVPKAVEGYILSHHLYLKRP